MKKILIIVASCWTLGASLPALAGPDFNAIEQARKAKQSAQQAEQPRPEANLPRVQAHVHLASLPCRWTMALALRRRRTRIDCARNAMPHRCKRARSQGDLTQ